MEIDDPKIVALRQKVTAAQQEFDMAVTYHEVWKPAAYDQDLHNRLGKSLATQAFLVARIALRREMILALMRLWDTNKRAIRMESVWDTLRDSEVIDALALDRVRPFGRENFGAMRNDLGERADQAVSLISKYREGGSCRSVLVGLRNLRHERLAHRQLVSSTAPVPATVPGANTTEADIEEFYQDNSKLIQILLSVVNAMAYDPEDTARVFRRYATSFWERISEKQT